MDPLRSPGTPWKKPSDVMKKIRKSGKRIPSVSKDEAKVEKMTKKALNFPSKTAINPFRCHGSQLPDNKKAKRTEIKDAGPGVFSMFRDLDASRRSSAATETVDGQVSLPTVKIESKFPSVPEAVWSDSLPVDWSLKSKARFISKKQFSWMSNLKTSEEASGITGFVRCLGGLSCSPDQVRVWIFFFCAHFLLQVVYRKNRASTTTWM